MTSDSPSLWKQETGILNTSLPILTGKGRQKGQRPKGPGPGEVWKADGTRQLPRFGGHQPLSFSLYHFGVKSQSHLLQRRTPAPYWSSQPAILPVKDAVALSQRDCAELRPRPLLSNWAGARGVRVGGAGPLLLDN